MPSQFYFVEWEYVYDHTNREGQLFCLEEYEDSFDNAVRRADEILDKEIPKCQINFSYTAIRLLRVVEQTEKKDEASIIRRTMVLEEIKRYTADEQKRFMTGE